MLTRSDLEQIKNYLALYGKKDSQLVKAITPLTGKEYLSLVQDGVNKIAPFSEILETIDYPLDKDILSYDEYVAIEYKSTQTLYIITDTGDSTGNVLQIFLGELPLKESGNDSVNLVVNHSVVFAGSGTSVNLTVTASKYAEVIKITKNGVDIISGSGTTVSTSDTVSVTTEYIAQANILGNPYTDSKTVTAVNPIYYGSGSSVSDFWEERHKVKFNTPTTSPYRTYNVTVRNDEDKVYFAVPSSMEIHKATMNGFDFPLDNPDTSISGYKIYPSSNTYDATGSDTLNIVIS